MSLDALLPEAASPAALQAVPSPAPGLEPGRLRLYSDGFLYACAGMASRSRRYATTLYIALGAAPFELTVGERTERCHVAAVKPMVAKTLHARGVPLLCVDLSPNHPHYRAFHALAGDGLYIAERQALAELMPDARAFLAGTLSCYGTRAMMYRAVELAAQPLPPPPPLDPRVQRVMLALEREPAAGWPQLQALACLSRDRFSHLFSRELGISLRLYAQTMKLHAAARYHGSGMSLAEIAQAAGFADGAHFSKVYARAFGRPPAETFHGPSIALYPLPEPVTRQTRRGLPVDTDAVWRIGQQLAEQDGAQHMAPRTGAIAPVSCAGTAGLARRARSG